MFSFTVICPTPTPTITGTPLNTPSNTKTPTPEPTPFKTPTPQPTTTPTDTPASTPCPTTTPTNTASLTNTASHTPSRTPTPTPTPTPPATPTQTPGPCGLVRGTTGGTYNRVVVSLTLGGGVDISPQLNTDLGRNCCPGTGPFGSGTPELRYWALAIEKSSWGGHPAIGPWYEVDDTVNRITGSRSDVGATDGPPAGGSSSRIHFVAAGSGILDGEAKYDGDGAFIVVCKSDSPDDTVMVAGDVRLNSLTSKL